MHVLCLCSLVVSGQVPVVLDSVAFLGHAVDVQTAGKWNHYYLGAIWL
jgi:hypothetical protein